MVDEGPNLVTPEGMAQIEAHVARIEAALKTEAQYPVARNPGARSALLVDPQGQRGDRAAIARRHA